MKNKKGFTLVELLAVIVILAVIALIATPQVLGMIEQAKESSAVDSAYGYIEALEKQNAMAVFDNKYKLYEEGNYNIEEVEITLKGVKPTSGTLKINNKTQVIEAEICIEGYLIKYQINKKAQSIGKCDSKLNTKTSEEIYYNHITYTNGKDITLKEAMDNLYSKVR